jgi:hypothetical protein
MSEDSFDPLTHLVKILTANAAREEFEASPQGKRQLAKEEMLRLHHEAIAAREGVLRLRREASAAKEERFILHREANAAREEKFRLRREAEDAHYAAIIKLSNAAKEYAANKRRN